MFDDLSALPHTLIVGSLAYLILILLLRISGKRTLSKWNAFDFVVTVAFGSVLATTLMSKQTTLAQGSLGLGLLVIWQFFLTWLSVRSQLIRQLIKGEPTLLLFQGEFQEEALQKERVTQGEIRAAVRSKGISALETVAAVVLETDGTFSVIKETNDEKSDSALADVSGFRNARLNIR
ncbi:DUF421 domain-containing protein [Oscillatoria sp. CS-180]|uniref:DUF421 domain-containing protein n=1 Tax=Oscillatoria sp. CS-180 TaxID=3021720 RepID=UPI00232E8D3B|nr:YetF domain-containing protein [Oscillatoria sp. CS-180]MDB9526561.1 DUF421 domain-containing protein [Oscillatoria sp. CS-180]